eukprot:TRINITY_DN32341_c0_g1_i1.p1 TRINITY_DN32341_c0_g1~~TRINITY_DN32341_c0_g1_i1.p1  ORF type:complete len:885 (+),score=302.63 TRINITY_DN32341_c0_g1_i1:82-2736(+)
MAGMRRRSGSGSDRGPNLKRSLIMLGIVLLMDIAITVLLALSAHDWKFPDVSMRGFHTGTFDLLVLLGVRLVLLLASMLVTLRWRNASRLSDETTNIQDADSPDVVPADTALLLPGHGEENDPIVLSEKAKMPTRKKQEKSRNVLFSVAFIVCVACGVYCALKGVNFDRASGQTGRAQAVLFCLLVVILEAHLFFSKRVLAALTYDPGCSLPTIHAHAVKLKEVAMHKCDLCSARITDGLAFQCHQCDFDICLACFRARNKRTGEGVLRGDKGAREEKVLSSRDLARWGWTLSSGFRHYILLAVIALCLNQTTRIFLPNFQGKVIDSVISKDRDRFWNMLQFYGIMSAGTMLFGVIRLSCVSIVSRKLGWAVRYKAFSAIIHQDIAFFDGAQTGQLTSVMGTYTTAMVSPINTLVNQLLANIILLLGSLTMCIYTSWKLSLLAFTAVGPIIYVTGQYAAWSRNINRQIWDKLAEAQGIAQEAFSNIRTVRSFSTEEQEKRKYQEQNSAALEKGMRDSVASAGTYGITNFLDLGTMVLILGYGGVLAMNGNDKESGDLSVGELITFQLYVNMMNSAYQSLNSVVNSFTRAAGAAQKVLAVLESHPDIDPHGGIALDAPPEGGFLLEGVDFAYQMRPDQKVLKGCSLNIPPRSTTALVGRSGGGKSTLVHLLMRFYDPRSGVIKLDGRPLPEYNLTWFHQHLGIVSQDTQLFAKTIEYNIAYGAPDGTTKEDIELAARRAYAHDFISTFDEGYQTRVGERGVRLSGGQKQRIAIARAFLRKPRLLLLDEATSALDAEAEHMVQQAIDELVSSMSGGCTIVMIAHRLSTVRNADQIALIADGAVKEVGTHDELLALRGDYAALVERQLDGKLDQRKSPAPDGKPRGR